MSQDKFNKCNFCDSSYSDCERWKSGQDKSFPNAIACCRDCDHKPDTRDEEIATLRKERAELIDNIKRALVAHDEGVYDVSARVLEAVLAKVSGEK